MPLAPISAESSASKPKVLAVSSSPDSKQSIAETNVLDDSVTDSTRKGHSSMNNEEPSVVIYGNAKIAITRDYSGPIVTDDLGFSDELSAISMTEKDHRQNLEELESL